MVSAIYQANGRQEGSMQNRGENKYAKNPESKSKLLPSGSQLSNLFAWTQLHNCLSKLFLCSTPQVF